MSTLEKRRIPASKVTNWNSATEAKAAKYASVQRRCDDDLDCVNARNVDSKPGGSMAKMTRGSFLNSSYAAHAFFCVRTFSPMILEFVRWRSNAICVTLQNAQDSSFWSSNHARARAWCWCPSAAYANQTLASASLIPEAVIQIRTRRIDDTARLALNQGSRHPLTPELRRALSPQ